MKPMTNRIFGAMSLLTAIFFSGCGAVQASNRDELPMENVTQCQSLCSSVNMTLGAVVVVANQTGCVCEVSGRSEAGGSSSATGGAVAQLLQQQAAQQKKQSEQQLLVPVR